MKWRPLEADEGRTENVIYIAIAAGWRPVEADGGRIENAIYNVIAAKWRPVEAVNVAGFAGLFLGPPGGPKNGAADLKFWGFPRKN